MKISAISLVLRTREITYILYTFDIWYSPQKSKYPLYVYDTNHYLIFNKSIGCFGIFLVNHFCWKFHSYNTQYSLQCLVRRYPVLVSCFTHFLFRLNYF